MEFNLFFGVSDDFKPTSVYSFEFRDRETDYELSTINLLLPPVGQTIKEPFLTTVTKTISGVHVDDFGNDVKDITLKGNINFFFAGRPPENTLGSTSGPMRVLKDLKQKISGIGKDLATQALPGALTNKIPGLEFVTGLQEMYRLRYAVSRIRDKVNNPPKELLDIKNLHSLVGGLENFNFKNVKVIYRDWDDNNHYEVVFVGDFVIERNADKVFDFDYSIQMKGIQEVKLDQLIIGDVGTKPSTPEVSESLADLLTDAIKPIDDVFNAATDLQDAYDNVVDGINSLLGEGGTINRMLTQRRNKFYRVTSSIEEHINFVVELLNSTEEKKDSFDAVVLGVNKMGGTGSASFTPVSSVQINQVIEESTPTTEIENKMSSALGSEIAFTNLVAYEDVTEEIKVNVIEDESSQTPTLDSDEFFTEDDDIVSDQVKKSVRLYTVASGDTAFSISHKFYGSYESYKLVIDKNNIAVSDFDNGVLVGKEIKILFLDKTPTQNVINNQIIKEKKQFPTKKEKLVELYGNDFRMSNGAIVADNTGDFSFTGGEETLINNLTDRLENEQGSLNEVHPGWGLRDLVGFPNNLDSASIVAEAIEAQTEKDPRVSTAVFNKSTFERNGDKIAYSLTVQGIAGEDVPVNLINGVSGGR